MSSGGSAGTRTSDEQAWVDAKLNAGQHTVTDEHDESALDGEIYSCERCGASTDGDDLCDGCIKA